MQCKYLKKVALGLAAMMALNGCQENIDEGARFTFVGNTIATYLQREAPECSHFVEILTRGGCIGLMKAYGMYTCFAPTNEAIEQFVKEQYTIWDESVKKHEETLGMPNEVKIVDTGIYEDDWTKLSDEKCAEIARNHILPRKYMRGDLMGNSIPDANMNDRDLTLDVDTLDGIPLINSTAKVLVEEEVENGVVHILNGVVNPSSLDVPTLMSDYNYFGIFIEALKKTGYDVMLTKDNDDTYTEGDKIVLGIRDTQQAPYPQTRRYGFTVFVESNEVFNKHGVEDFDDLVEKCKEWYPEFLEDGKPNMVWAYNEDKKDFDYVQISHSVTDYKDARHPVNQFVGYHLLDRKVSFDNLVCHEIRCQGKGFEFYSEDDFPKTADRTEYYVTMNNRILKATMPLNSNCGDDYSKKFLNYGYSTDGLLAGPNVRVLSPNEFKKSNEDIYANYDPEASNGSLNVIEDVLLYDDGIMKSVVLNCIIRFDVSSICSELTNNRIRWKSPSQLNTDGDVFIPHKYCERLEVYSDDTRLFYLAPHTAWHNYQGDEMMALGFFDFAYKLPPLPENTYEIRMGYSASTERHVVQVYLDNEVTGLPIDLRLTGEKPQVGWESDKDLGDEEKIAAKDKDMKNRGYLKGPTTFYDNEKNAARDNELCLRAVIATKHLTAGSHKLRFKNVNDEDDGKAQFMHDYFEIVPITYLRDDNVSVDDKRK